MFEYDSASYQKLYIISVPSDSVFERLINAHLQYIFMHTIGLQHVPISSMPLTFGHNSDVGWIPPLYSISSRWTSPTHVWRVCTCMHTTATISTFKLTAGLCIRFQLLALLAAAVLLVRACTGIARPPHVIQQQAGGRIRPSHLSTLLSWSYRHHSIHLH